MSPSNEDGMMRRRRLGGGGQEEPAELHQRLGDERDLRTEEEGLQIIGQELVAAVNGDLREREVRGDTRYETPGRPTTSSPRPIMPALPDLRDEGLPLFSEAQLQQVERLQQSPLLQGMKPHRPEGRGQAVRTESSGSASKVGKGKGDYMADLWVPPPRQAQAQRYHMGTRPPSTETDEAFADEMVWRWRMSQQMSELELQLRATREENRRLRREVVDLKAEARYQTPDSEVKATREDAEKPAQDGSNGKGSGQNPPDAEDQRNQILLLMLQGMQDMHKKLMDKEESGSVAGVEVVRSGVQDLPVLGEWDPAEAPLRMGDWLALLEPAMADLSTSSETWWQTMMEEVTEWYQRHIKMPPLERAAHEPVIPDSLMKKQWQRLERRVASLLLRSIPEQQREELVSSKRLSVFGILCHLQLVYQPGGLGEKQTLIRSLEDPPEAQTLGEAVQLLRRWMRWRQRARELQTSEPDPTVLIRALTRITSKVLESNKELNFRLALARSQLLVDTAPTREVVNQFTTHLLAEMEQVSHMEKKAGIKGAKGDGVKVKKLGDEVKVGDKGADKKIKEIKKEEDGGASKAPCRFYMTDNGCRKGRSCTWPHVLDESLGTKKRCWTCGSIKHFSTACPTASTGTTKGAEGPDQHHKVKTVKEDHSGVSQSSEGGSKPASEDGEEQMKHLIEEANKMLKSLHRKSEPPVDSTKDTIEHLQKQLNELKGRNAALRALRLTKMNVESEEQMALLDSGATHPMRSLEVGDRVDGFQRVMVSLADGKKAAMLMSPHGVMITTDLRVEPIIPLGWLADIGCRITWSSDGLTVRHPHRGLLPVVVQAGCPQIPRSLALDLIKEFENDRVDYLLKTIQVEKKRMEVEGEEHWLKEVVRTHPVLRNLPEHIKSSLPVQPGEWADLPVNRHRRKRLRPGYALHLFAGEKDGYTLEKAMRERNLSSRLLEVDIKRGDSHDMAGNSKTYAGLLRTALDGALLAVVGGPNCRSRSVLRHYPDGPRPVRAWNGEEFGLVDLTISEKLLVQEDDILMWRFVFLVIVSDMARKAKGETTGCQMALEQPSEPDYMPATVSWWRTEEWKKLKELMGWHEQHFNQGDYTAVPKEVPVKPTTVGGSLLIETPTIRNVLAKGRDPKGSKGSQSLARWVPGLMRAMAEALGRLVFEQEVTYQLRALSWSEHCEAGHVPFRRDCRVCQEASAKGRPHLKVTNPLCGTLSVDTAGPFLVGHDYDIKNKYRMRYILVGAFTWLKPSGGDSDPPWEVPGDGEEMLPVIDDDRSDEAGEEEDVADEEDAAAPDELQEGVRAGPEEEREPGDREERREPEVNVFRLCLPMETKSAREVLQTINTMYLQLRMSGYSVVKLHTDMGGEYRGRPLRQWCASRSIYKTTTAGVSPQSNGRAERAVQEVKARIQRNLLASGLSHEAWPQACRYVHEMERRRWTGRDERPCPPFGAEVLVKRRFWGRQDLQPNHEVVRYMAPDPDSHGHRVMKENGMVAVSPYFIGRTVNPPVEEAWVALLAEQDRDHRALDIRRRIRGKVALRSQRLVGMESITEENAEAWIEDEEEMRRDHHHRLQAVLQQEASLMVQDDFETMTIIFDELRKIKAAVPVVEEDVLRTRIVSVQELLREKEKWDDAIRGEMRQLFDEKRALVKLTSEEFEQIKKDYGPRLSVIPMKAVLTKKPGPRRRFRMVACGNFVEKTEVEDVFASGADALAVRFALKKGAEMGWKGLTVDVKVAFLNAPLIDEEDPEEDGTMVVLKPPSLIVRLGYAGPGEYYRADKAIYGLRQSPKRWGDHRDRKLVAMRTPSGYVLRPSDAEPNLWRIIWVRSDEELSYEDELTSELYGLIVVYVDDMLMMSTEEILREVLQTIQKEWATSPPEWLGSESVRFLGMEISEHPDGFLANQMNYICDKVDGMTVRFAKTPTVKEMYPPPEDNVSESDVRQAQKDVGELLWLTTRTRPELSFVTSRMSQQILNAPRWVHDLSATVWGYLRDTAEEGILFRRDGGVNVEDGSPAGLQAFSDISFSPSGDGSVSHGAVYVTWNGGLMWWRSSRQPFPTLSTAEAELVEGIEAFTLGDSIDVLISEFEGFHAKRLLIDNAAAVSLLGDGPTSWRTRHLRLRAQTLRWRVTSLDWKINFVPGSHQLADLGTKSLAAPRLQVLKDLAGMGRPSRKEEDQDRVGMQLKGIKRALFLGLAASQVKGGRADSVEEGSVNEILSWPGMFLVGMCLSLGCLWMMRWILDGCARSSDDSLERVSEDERSRGDQSLLARGEEDMQPSRHGDCGPVAGMPVLPVRTDEARIEESHDEPDLEPEIVEDENDVHRPLILPLEDDDYELDALEEFYDPHEDDPHDGPEGEVSGSDLRTSEVSGLPSPYTYGSGATTSSDEVDRPPRFNVFGVGAYVRDALLHADRPEPDGEPDAARGSPGDPDEAEHTMEPRTLFLTKYGKKYHRDEDCPGLMGASQVYRSLYCSECSLNYGVGRRDLHGRGPGYDLHRSIQHAAIAGPDPNISVKTYGYCTRCAVLE